MKKTSNYFLIAILILSIFFIASSNILNSVIGVSNILVYEDDLASSTGVQGDFYRLESGTFTTLAYLQLPNKTNSFSFTIDPSVSARRDSSTTNYPDCKISIKYEILNTKTNSFELVSDKTWNLLSIDGAELQINGETIYQTGIPDGMSSVNTAWSSTSSNRRYTKYVSCLEGMSVNEAKQLYCESFPLSTACTDSRYSTACVYPDGTFSDHGKDDDSDENWDIYYFPKLNTYNSDYINYEKSEIIDDGDKKTMENFATFRIVITKYSLCDDPSNARGIDINLQSVETEIIDTYQFNGTDCNYKSKYTYQISQSDYFTRNECEYQNNIVECYIDDQCSADDGYTAYCENKICTQDKNTIIDILFPDKDEPINDNQETEKKSNLILLVPILIIVIFIFYSIFKIKKKK